MNAKGPPVLQTLWYLMLLRGCVEGSRLVIRLFLGSDHGIALIRFVRVGGTSEPLCVEDESDCSLNKAADTMEGSRQREAAHLGAEQSQGEATALPALTDCE